MKSTLLELAQDISSAMDGDEFGSIDDTFEAEQIVTIIRTVYRDLVSNRNWPHLKQAITLTPSGDTAKPTHVTIEDDVKELVLLNYDTSSDTETRTRYLEMTWLENDDFLRRANALNTDESYVQKVTDPSGIIINIRNDKAPKYYTSFDDSTLIFDSFDSDVEATLQSSKFQAIAYKMPVFQATDSFEIDLPEEAFSALYNEAKSLAFIELRQVNHAKAEQEARRQQRWLAREASKLKGGVRYPNYGRRSAKRLSITTK